MHGVQTASHRAARTRSPRNATSDARWPCATLAPPAPSRPACWCSIAFTWRSTWWEYAGRSACLAASLPRWCIATKGFSPTTLSTPGWQISGTRPAHKQPHDDWIRAVNFEIQVPRVIRLLGYDRLPKQHLHLNRRNVLARDEHLCQYCGRHFPLQQLSLDHVLPRSRGGGTTWENVVCACLSCNVKKGGRTPHEAKMKLVRRPARPQRNPLLMLKVEQSEIRQSADPGSTALGRRHPRLERQRKK